MRCWVNPDKLANLKITVPEIISAIQAQNNVNPAGNLPHPDSSSRTRCALLAAFPPQKSLVRSSFGQGPAKAFCA
jgi:multidrug efflux pump subunit AcrB